MLVSRNESRRTKKKAYWRARATQRHRRRHSLASTLVLSSLKIRRCRRIHLGRAWICSTCHYQTNRYFSCRPQTIKNEHKTVRKYIPVGQQSGICHQQTSDRNNKEFLTSNRRTNILDGSSCRF